jgi:hypothetical protein
VSGIAAFPHPASIDLAPACAIQRSILFASSLSVLFAVLGTSNAVHGAFTEKPNDFSGGVLIAVLFLSVFGFLKLSTQLFGPVLLSLALVAVLLTYALFAALLMVDGKYLASITLCVLTLIQLLLTIRALRNMSDGALCFSSVAQYKRKWARNGSFRRFVVLRGLLRPKAALYLAAAVACIFALPFAQETFPTYPFWGLVAVAAAWWLFREGGRQAAVRAVESEEDLPPSFTLYLRSFLDDSTQVSEEKRGLDAALRALFGELDILLGYSSSLEEASVASLWPFDPVLCLGRDSSQPFGALRMQVSDRDWQAAVLRLCETATRIVLMISPTSGLAWEFREILNRGLQAKLIVLLPPELPRQTAARWGRELFAADQLLTRWTESVRGTFLESAPDDLLENSLAVRFRSDGSPIYLKSNARTVVAYGVAISAACLPVAKLNALSE